MSRVISLPNAMLAYDFALQNWEKTFGYPVYARSCFWGARRTVWRWRDIDASGYWSYGHTIERYGWPMLLSSLAIGGDGPTVDVTFPENIFSWRGPFSGNLRSYFQSQISRLAYGQGKAREKGVWVGGADVNKMLIRVPHK